MRDRERTILPLEKRLEMAAKSQASSPEAAAKLVQRLSGVHTAYFFCGSADMNIMEGLTGEFWGCLEKELLHYGGFCHSFRLQSSTITTFQRQFHLKHLRRKPATRTGPSGASG